MGCVDRKRSFALHPEVRKLRLPFDLSFEASRFIILACTEASASFGVSGLPHRRRRRVIRPVLNETRDAELNALALLDEKSPVLRKWRRFNGQSVPHMPHPCSMACLHSTVLYSRSSLLSFFLSSRLLSRLLSFGTFPWWATVSVSVVQVRFAVLLAVDKRTVSILLFLWASMDF